MAYDLTLGRLALPTLTDDVKEGVGDPLEVEGTGVALGKRRVKPYAFNIPIHGETVDSDPYGAGLRLRRQLRAMLQNGPYRGQSLYLYFGPDSELNGWMMVGSGDIQYANGGVSLGEFQLTLDELYRIGSLRTHRPARRLEQYDLRLSTTPRDVRGTLYSVDFASLTPLALAYLPSNVTDLVGLTVLLASGALATADGGSLSIVTSQVHGTVISYEQAEANRLKGDVIVADMRARSIINGALNPDWEIDTGNWAVSTSSGAIALNRQTGDFVTAAAAGEAVVTGAAGTVNAQINGTDSTSNLPVTPGQTVGVRSQVKNVSGTITQFLLQVRFQTAAGAFLSTVTAQTLANPTQGSWIPMAGSVTVPASAAFCSVQLVATGTTAAFTFRIDNSTLLVGSVPTSYIDGDVAGYSWSGQAQYSFSIGPGEEVYGPDYPLGAGAFPDMQNGLCRVRPFTDASGSSVAVDVWNGAAWVEQGRMVPFTLAGDGVTPVSAAVIEYSPERAVVEAVYLDTATNSRVTLYITLQRGWSGPRFDTYTDRTNPQLLYVVADADSNDSLMRIDATGTLTATAGSGSSLFTTGAFGGATLAGENEIVLLRSQQRPAVSFAFVQAALTFQQWQDSVGLGYRTGIHNGLYMKSTNNPLVVRLGYSVTQADQALEAEAMAAGVGTSTVADATASGGSTTQSTRTTDANPHVTRSSWPNGYQARYRIFARVKTSVGTSTLNVYAKTIATLGPTKTTVSTSYVWLDLGDVVAGNLEIHAWLSAAGTLSVDRIEAVLLEDRTLQLSAPPLFSGARDLGQAILYDTRLVPELVARA